METLYEAWSTLSKHPSQRKSSTPLRFCVFRKFAYRVNGVAPEDMPQRFQEEPVTFEFFADLRSATNFAKKCREVKKYACQVGGDVSSTAATVYEETLSVEIVEATAK
jgi:hypothetical protein